MKLKFYWYISEAYMDGILRPACACIDAKESSDEFIANYLMDDGGLFYFDSISWLKEILEKISIFKKQKNAFLNLSRETWTADFSTSGVRVYSLHDENCVREISLNAMELALFEWVKFLEATPEIEKSLVIDLSSLVDE